MTAKTPVKPFTKHLHADQPQNYDEVLDRDSRPAPDVLRNQGDTDIGPLQVPTRWYLDRQIHELEKEKLWKRTWQMACRTEDIPVVGDVHVYNVCGMSFLIVRSAPDTIKGYWNACLHRGLELRSCSGRVDRLQCPFHGFTWGLDGSCQLIPYPEEFPYLQQEKFSLLEVKVGVWDDFVFINPDKNAEPFEKYLGSLPEQFTRWSFKGRYKAIHFAKVFNTNWKALQEAFMESWHAMTTHPQQIRHMAERCVQFWASENYSRGINVQGYSNDYLPYTPSEQDIMDSYCSVWADQERPAELVVPPGKTARSMMADRIRASLRPALGEWVEQMCDSECVDIYYWTLFANFHPFGGWNAPFVYRFLPYKDDHTRSVMEVMMIRRLAPGQKPPPPPEVQWLSEDEDFTAAKGGLAGFLAFINQDVANMDGIMSGLRNNQLGYVNLAKHQELKIRHFYHLYEKQLGLSAADEVAELRNR